jgi:hypothetical protein
MGKLAAYVLQTGFGVKNPESFIVAPEPPAAPEAPPEQSVPEQGVPMQGGDPLAGLPPELLQMLMAGGGAPPQPPMDPMMDPSMGGLPPEMLL